MKIAFFGDMHFPTSTVLDNELKNARDKLFFSFLQKVFSLEADIFISLGDLVLEGLKEEMEEVYSEIRKYDKNFFHILGNHDATHFTLDELKDGEFRVGDTHLNYPTCDIILLQSPRYKDMKNYGGFLSRKQLLWLEESIKKSEDKPLFIFSHHPIFDTVRKSNYPMQCIDEECGVYDVLKNKKQKSFFINGHNHSDSIVQKDNWSFISANCIIDARAVKLLHVKKDEVLYETFDFTTKEDTILAEYLVKNIKNFNFSKYGVGTSLERNKIFTLR